MFIERNFISLIIREVKKKNIRMIFMLRYLCFEKELLPLRSKF